MLVGRGGKRGKTSGRGGKGQTARAGHKSRPELRDFIKRIPKLRGRGVNQNKSPNEKPVVVNLDAIEAVFESGAIISPATLIEKRTISTQDGRIPQVKILGTGELTKKFTIEKCIISKQAQVKVEKAGGSVKI
ncbi:MAG: large subunit ribosomal protein [Patescibacteria group bacterium]|nr:large subunit ribosomal protein [Patescibacteria group bacterium]